MNLYVAASPLPVLSRDGSYAVPLAIFPAGTVLRATPRDVYEPDFLSGGYRLARVPETLLRVSPAHGSVAGYASAYVRREDLLRVRDEEQNGTLYISLPDVDGYEIVARPDGTYAAAMDGGVLPRRETLAEAREDAIRATRFDRERAEEYDEESHGEWLNERISRGLPIALGEEVALRDVFGVATEIAFDVGTVVRPATDPATDTNPPGGLLYVAEDGGASGYVRRTDLLSAIAATADEIARAESAAGWDPNP